MIKKLLSKLNLLSMEETRTTKAGPGVLIERRQLLWLPLLTATALLFPKQYSAKDVPLTLTGAGVDWEIFIKEAVPNAKELHKDSSDIGQDAYLFWLASMAVRLNFSSIPKTKLSSFAGLNPPVETGLAYRGIPFFIIEWKMSPNALLPPHNHPNISVCTVCTEGEARIRNFNPVGETPDFSSAQEFLVRETHNEILTPGRINTLSAKRDNIHTFQAGNNGARGIDITTYHDKDIGFSFLKLQDMDNSLEDRTFKATFYKPN